MPKLADITFHVQDPKARPIAGALLSAISPNGAWQGLTNHDGDFTAHLAAGHYDITISASPGYQTRQLPADLSEPGTITIGLEFDGGLLPELHAGRADFFTETGVRHVIIGSTELLLAWHYDMEGAEAIRPILAQRRSCGFNNLRVLWQKDVGNAGHPWQLAVEDLRPFLALAADYGFYVEGTILADCPVVNPTESDQKARVSAVRSATVGVSNLLEQLGNEYEKNGHDPRHFSRPMDRIAANSSSIEGGTDAPYWDYFTFSGQRSPLNHAIREYGPLEFIYGDRATWGGLPAICDEGMKPGINSSDPRDFERAGAQARSGCGGRFHSEAGTIGNSRLFNDLELACAQAFVKGLGV